MGKSIDKLQKILASIIGANLMISKPICRCGQCFYVVDDEDKFCKNCGIKFKQKTE